MGSSLSLALQVTALGMVLVFLTLIIIAAVIKLLDRLFRPKPEAPDEGDEEGDPAEEAEAAMAKAELDAPEAAATGNEAQVAAAVGLAIALQRAKGRRAPAFDEDIVGEVVTVVAVEPGQGVWRGSSRLSTSN